MHRRVSMFAIPALAVFIATSCHQAPATQQATARPVGAAVAIKPPLGLPPLPIPPGNPPTADTIALGRQLFFDPRLSADNTLSCASCHSPRAAFSDPRPHSLGVGGQSGTRNAPPVLNAAFNTSQFWDGRATSLEDQAGGPIANPIEMNLSHELCTGKLNSDEGYGTAFTKSFGPGPITMEKVRMAIASYERTLIAGDSPFDRYQFGGDKTAMSPAAIRGLDVFKDRARGNCAACHTIGDHDALFTDGKFHNIGVGIDANGELTDLGRYNQTKVEADKGAFRTPGLRNIAQTAPYMHDGSKKTLKDVVEFYVGGGSSNPTLDKEIKELTLTAQEKSDLIEFLESLTGRIPSTE